MCKQKKTCKRGSFGGYDTKRVLCSENAVFQEKARKGSLF